MTMNPTTHNGVIEYSGLSQDSKSVLMYMGRFLLGIDTSGTPACAKAPFLLFTDPVSNGNGIKLFNFIQKNSLGNVVETPVRNNPNSHRDLQAFLWSVDRVALKEWMVDIQAEIDKRMTINKQFRAGEKVISNGTYIAKGFVGTIREVSANLQTIIVVFAGYGTYTINETAVDRVTEIV